MSDDNTKTMSGLKPGDVGLLLFCLRDRSEPRLYRQFHMGMDADPEVFIKDLRWALGQFWGGQNLEVHLPRRGRRLSLDRYYVPLHGLEPDTINEVEHEVRAWLIAGVVESVEPDGVRVRMGGAL